MEFVSSFLGFILKAKTSEMQFAAALKCCQERYCIKVLQMNGPWTVSYIKFYN